LRNALASAAEARRNHEAIEARLKVEIDRLTRERDEALKYLPAQFKEPDSVFTEIKTLREEIASLKKDKEEVLGWFEDACNYRDQLQKELLAAQERNNRGMWRCFHCNEVFSTPGEARDHFGSGSECDPACQIKIGEERGLVMALRKAEDELRGYRAEDSEKDRQIGSMRADHVRALLREEENGYNKGVLDMKKEIAAAVRERDDAKAEFVEWANLVSRYAKLSAVTDATIAAQSAALEKAREALDEISGMSSRTRHGGATPEDWPEYEDALLEAIQIAHTALAAIDAITGGPPT
jgi:chromosome segregation ATPase